MTIPLFDDLAIAIHYQHFYKDTSFEKIVQGVEEASLKYNAIQIYEEVVRHASMEDRDDVLAYYLPKCLHHLSSQSIQLSIDNMLALNKHKALSVWIDNHVEIDLEQPHTASDLSTFPPQLVEKIISGKTLPKNFCISLFWGCFKKEPSNFSLADYLLTTINPESNKPYYNIFNSMPKLFEIAAYNIKNIDYFASKGVDIHAYNQKLMSTIISYQPLDIFIYVFEQKKELYLQSRELLFTSLTRPIGFLKYLIQAGMEIDFTEEKMLMYAIQSGDMRSPDGRLAVIELLIEHGANIDIVKEHGDDEVQALLSRLLYEKIDQELPLKMECSKPKI